METDRLEGAQVNLVRLSINNIKSSFQKCDKAGLFDEIDLGQSPDFEKIRGHMTGNRLQIWEMYEPGSSSSIGWAGLVSYHGPTYIFIHEIVELSGIEIAEDCLVLLAHVFFKTQDEREFLLLYVEKQYVDTYHHNLIELGFDVETELDYEDSKDCVIYCMERHTFDAYYGDNNEFEEL